MLGVPSSIIVDHLTHLRRGQKVLLVEGHPIRYEVSAW
jgi:hypothetical protein